MPRYKFRLLRQMSVSGQQRDVGELVNEAAQWPNLRNYLSLEWIEKLPAADDDPDAVEYPPVAPRNKLAEVLASEGEPTELVVAGRSRTGANLPIRCLNCRKRNWLPADFLETTGWMCWSCAQPQTTVQAREHPAPTSLDEYVESVGADLVSEEGDLLPEALANRWTPGAGAAAATAAGVKP